MWERDKFGEGPRYNGEFDGRSIEQWPRGHPGALALCGPGFSAGAAEVVFARDGLKYTPTSGNIFQERWLGRNNA